MMITNRMMIPVAASGAGGASRRGVRVLVRARLVTRAAASPGRAEASESDCSGPGGGSRHGDG